jgi:hypothetical protein
MLRLLVGSAIIAFAISAIMIAFGLLVGVLMLFVDVSRAANWEIFAIMAGGFVLDILVVRWLRSWRARLETDPVERALWEKRY